MSKDTGGPAFPAEEIDDDQSVSQGRIVVKKMHLGMTLRDWYVGMAMQGLLANSALDTRDYDGLCRRATSYADEMIRQRNK